MSGKKESGVSVIITCQEEEAGTDLTTDEYDQLVKVLKIVRKIFIPHLSSLFPRWQSSRSSRLSLSGITSRPTFHPAWSTKPIYPRWSRRLSRGMRRMMKLWRVLPFTRCHHPEVVSANLFRKMIVIFNDRKSLLKPLRYIALIRYQMKVGESCKGGKLWDTCFGKVKEYDFLRVLLNIRWNKYDFFSYRENNSSNFFN